VCLDAWAAAMAPAERILMSSGGVNIRICTY
jgi:hypothetical protein